MSKYFLLLVICTVTLLSLFHNNVNALTMTNSYNATNTTGWNGYVFSEEFIGLGANSAISSLALELANGNTNRTSVLDKETTHGVGFSGIVQVQQFTVPQNSVINHVDLKVFAASGNVIVKVYADSGGSPSTLIGESGSIAPFLSNELIEFWFN